MSLRKSSVMTGFAGLADTGKKKITKSKDKKIKGVKFNLFLGLRPKLTIMII